MRGISILLVVTAGCWRGDSSSTPVSPAESVTRVTSMQELVAALRPNATIALAPGDYAIDKLARTPGPHHRWANVFEGSEYPEFEEQDMFVIENLHDVTIKAAEPRARTRLVTGIASATVIVVKDSTNVTFQDLSIGHSVEGTCGGGVVIVLGGSNVRLDSCRLSGSGTFGVEAYRTKNLSVTRSRIFHTSEGALRIFDTDGVSIADTTIDDNKSVSSFVIIAGSQRVTLDRLVIRNNRITDTAVDDQSIFSIGENTPVTVRDTQIIGNTAEFFRAGALKSENLTLRDNVWTTAEVAP